MIIRTHCAFLFVSDASSLAGAVPVVVVVVVVVCHNSGGILLLFLPQTFLHKC